MSLSRLIYIRAKAAEPLPALFDLSAIKVLGAIGNNLNQAVHLFHRDGLNAEIIAEILQIVNQLQQELIRL